MIGQWGIVKTPVAREDTVAPLLFRGGGGPRMTSRLMRNGPGNGRGLSASGRVLWHFTWATAPRVRHGPARAGVYATASVAGEPTGWRRVARAKFVQALRYADVR